MNEFLKRHWLLGFVITGAFLFFAGLAGMLLFGSLPGPDDAPAVANRNAATGNLIVGALLLGAVVFVFGAIAAMTRFAVRKLRQWH